MSKKALMLFVSFFFYVLSPPRGINAKPTISTITQNLSTSVFDAMTNDEGLCPSGKPFGQSNYVKVCKNFGYPKDDVILKSTNSEQFMCLGVYDRIYRLCHLDSLKMTKKSVMPDNADQFDRQVAESIPNNGEAIVKLCKTWKNEYPPKYNKTERFVMQLEKAIRQPALCIKHCTADDASVVPLCVVLATMDNLSELLAREISINEATSKKVAIDAHATSLQAQQSQAIVEHDSKIAVANSQQLNNPHVNIETTVEAAQLQKSTETQRTKESSNNNVAKLQKQLPEAPISDLKSQQQTSHALPAAQAEKLGADAQIADVHAGDITQKTKIKATEKQNSGKPDETTISGSGKKIEASKGIGTHADEATLSQPADGAALTQPADEAALSPSGDGTVHAQPADGVALTPSGGEAGLLQNEGISGEDISGEDMRGILDAAKLGSISQHTQEDPEPEFGGANGLEPAAVESPALVDEDSDQSAVQPSDKREYIPHMPSPNEEDSHFFGYFTVIGVMCIAGYVGYHNKQKILAMVLEGRRSRGGRSRRRPSTANYRKLDCTLEEAVTSQCNSNVTHVIY